MADILYITDWTRGDGAPRNLGFYLSKLGHNVELLICPIRRTARMRMKSFGPKCKTTLMNNPSFHFKRKFSHVPTINPSNLPYYLDQIDTSQFDIIILDSFWANARFTKNDLRYILERIKRTNKYFLSTFYHLFNEAEHINLLDLAKGPTTFIPKELSDKYIKPFYASQDKIYQIVLPQEKMKETWEKDTEEYVNTMYLDIRYLEKSPPLGVNPRNLYSQGSSKITYKEKLEHIKWMVHENGSTIPTEVQFTKNILQPQGEYKLKDMIQSIFLTEEGYQNIADQVHKLVN